MRVFRQTTKLLMTLGRPDRAEEEYQYLAG